MTDNTADSLLQHEAFHRHVAVFTPSERAFSSDTDVAACKKIHSVAETVATLVEEHRYDEAMTINGFAFSATLGFSSARMLDALPAVTGVSLSGTGPSTVAIGSEDAIDTVIEQWEKVEGTTVKTTTQNDGGTIL